MSQQISYLNCEFLYPNLLLSLNAICDLRGDNLPRQQQFDDQQDLAYYDHDTIHNKYRD